MSLLLGIDLGTSFIKVSVVDSQTFEAVATVQYPDKENEIKSLHPGWAEQDPENWWKQVQAAILKAHSKGKYSPKDIMAIGIAYQMHGLVLVDKNQNVLRDAIIWCDSRAVGIGDTAFAKIGEEKCRKTLLNSPGNFTASKLGWVKEQEPEIYRQTDRFMLPGDFIAMKLTGEITTTPSALSEAILYDFEKGGLSSDVMEYFGFDKKLVPEQRAVFSIHGCITKEIAGSLSLQPGIPVGYKAGDQMNNALSFNVLLPGEAAASAGTSGVIYAISDHLTSDEFSRINSFAHVNHLQHEKRIGVMVCINGCGIMNSWIKKIFGSGATYENMNEAAAQVPIGSDGLKIIPFGNGAERILKNRYTGAQMIDIDLNRHGAGHIYRAALESVAFAFRYGLDIMKENQMNLSVIRASRAGLFHSGLFTEIFVNACNVPVDIYDSEASTGAAIGAGIGAGIYKTGTEAFEKRVPLKTVRPSKNANYDAYYEKWKGALEKKLDHMLIR